MPAVERLKAQVRVAGLALPLVMVAGCADQVRTRIETFPLVTLVVTDDRREVEARCLTPLDAVRGARPLGCVGENRAVDGRGDGVRRVTVVRWTETLPSELAVEVEAHELCHVVAMAQRIPDPCHDGGREFTRRGLR